MKQGLGSLALLVSLSGALQAQVDTNAVEDDFDFSQFELAAEPAQAFCNNKVLGQTPSPLIGVYYDYQLAHDFTAGSLIADPNAQEAINNPIENAQGISVVGNFPLISRNNILINLGLTFQQQRYQFENSPQHALTRNLAEAPLNRAVSQVTVFKPLSETRFILGQLALEFNGDYSFSTGQSLSTLRIPAALLYGFKPSDRLMYAFGLSRTYLGGALNYVPVAYYYHTFRNQKWGFEGLLPARGMLRYRFNSLSLMSLGFNVTGATYQLNNFGANVDAWGQSQALSPDWAAAQEVELRRSEIRVGLNYSRQLYGFFWLSAEAGYRINYSYELDQDGDFLRFFGSSKPYFVENELANPLYFSIGLSYVSP